MKENKRFSVVEGKLNQKKWETYCHFPICVLISVHFFTMPNTTITTVATSMTPSLLPLPTTQPPPLSPYYLRCRDGSRPRPKWWGQAIHLSLLNPPNPLTLPLLVIMFITSPFSTLLSPPLHQRFFWGKNLFHETK